MKILRLETVKVATGHKSHTSIYSAIKKGLFTVPVRIGLRSVGWPDYEVVALCQARVAGLSDVAIRQLVSDLHASRKQMKIWEAT